MTPDMHGRVAIVTGAGKGLGKAYALWLAAHGCAVVINNRVHPGVPSTAALLATEIVANGGRAIAHEGAIDDLTAAADLIRLAIDHFGRLDILICNAGVMPEGPFAEADMAELARAVDINLWGAIYPLQAAWRHMNAVGYGRIVLSGSTVGLYGHADHALYGATRSAMVGLARSLALEAPSDSDIGINVILPQAFTNLYARQLPEHLRKEAGRGLSPDSVAPVAGWLCSEQCRVSGMIFNTGGGRVSRAAIIESVSIPVESLDMDIITSPTFLPDAANEPGSAAQSAARMKAGRIDI